ncbi:MAG: type II toxin-antitoxin system VapC family toxin [Pirellulales bacterium]|nr:type II toxin-antitoxin system VapC family toxin [Pirellulales bacterium]
MGKYSLPEDFTDFMRDQIAENQRTVLPVSIRHAAVVSTLPFYHRDPFDRLLAAQAIVENVELLSSDESFDSYPVKRMW